MIWENDYLILAAAYQTPKPHKHLGLHLLFALDGRLDCLVEGRQISCAGICIDSNILHTARAEQREKRELVVLIEKTSLLAQQVRNCFLWTGEEYRRFSALPEEFVDQIRLCYRNGDENEMMQTIRTLGSRWNQRSGITDERILAVLKEIRAQQTIDQDIYKTLCQIACLSQSRLSHLFKAQVGVSLAGYLTWTKLEKACMLVQSGEKLTSAAVSAGFSSPSHLSATFQRMFGISCSDLFRSL